MPGRPFAQEACFQGRVVDVIDVTAGEQSQHTSGNVRQRDGMGLARQGQVHVAQGRLCGVKEACLPDPGSREFTGIARAPGWMRRVHAVRLRAAPRGLYDGTDARRELASVQERVAVTGKVAQWPVGYGMHVHRRHCGMTVADPRLRTRNSG
jgi:hypothetical protein